jgi:DNA-binding transcriptional MerR regulator
VSVNVKNLQSEWKVMKKQEKLLRIGDVAAIAGVPVHTLRYWEHMFKEVVDPCRTEGGQRHYRERDIEKILEIKSLLKDEGYSIAGARRTLKNREKKEEVPLSYMKNRLNWSHIAQEVTELIREKLSDEMQDA